jgi:Flp pilus assembly protein TadG
VSFVLVVLVGVLSLAMDYGRVASAEAELQDAADAAARYAAAGLSDGTWLAKAQAVAAENDVDGTAVSIQAADVQVGVWNSATGTFTPTSSSPNAVRVTARRSKSRGNAVPLVLGQAIGVVAPDIVATSIATGGSTSYDLIGLGGVSVTGQTSISRLATESGTVRVASNGTVNVAWGCKINGDVYYRNAAPTDPGSGITGAKTAITADLSYAAPTAPAGAIDLGNVVYANGGTFNLPAGNYKCGTLTVGGGAVINVNGDVNVYASGYVNIGGGATINTNSGARKLSLYVTNSSTVDFNMSSAFHMAVYAPLSTVNVAGSSPLIGSVIASQLNVGGSGTIRYSSQLPAPGAGGGVICLVQ